MAIGIRKHPHVSETRFYIAKFTGGVYHLKNVSITPSSLRRFCALVKSGKYDLFTCERRAVLLRCVIQ